MGDHSQRSTSVLSLRFQRSCVLSHTAASVTKVRGLKASMLLRFSPTKIKPSELPVKKGTRDLAEERRSGIITRGLDDSARLSLNKHGD